MSNFISDITKTLNLSLENLLTPEEIATLQKGEKKRKAKKKPTIQPEDKKASKTNIGKHWQAEAIILEWTHYTCQCGATFEAPGSFKPLVRFVNTKDSRLWEVAEHPSIIKPGLKKETRSRHQETHICKHCFNGEPSLEFSLNHEEETHS